MAERKTLPEGIHFDVPAAVYFADPAPEPSLNQSTAKILIDCSPRHAWVQHPRLNPEYEPEEQSYKKAQAIGNAAHAILLGRGKEIAVLDFKDFRSKDAQLARDKAVAFGREVILKEHHADAVKLCECVSEQVKAVGWRDAFDQKTGDGEVVLVWEESGLWFRTMIDWLPKHQKLMYDLKTGGGSFAPHLVGQKVIDDGWDVQAAMIERGLNKLAGNAKRLFRFCALENYEPYALAPVELTEHHLTMGRKKLDVAIDLWRICMVANKWPGYPSRVIRPEYPPYAETKWLSREVEYVESGIGMNDRFTPEELYKQEEVE